MQLTWTIENLIVAPHLAGKIDVVVSASWRVLAEENGLRGTTYGRVNFPAPEGDKFTAYDNLTESEILSWVWEVGASTDPDFPWSKQIAEQQAIAAIDAQRAAVTERPLPWVPPPPPVEPRPTIDERLQAAETLINLMLDEGEV